MRALELSPFLWDAYQELCDLRTAPESELVFGARTAPTLIPRPAAPANPNPSKKAQSRKRNRDGERKPESGPTSDADDATDTQPQRKKRATSAGDAILHDFQLLGAAYRHLTRYESREALQAFAGVSEAHLKTGWVMTQMARCFYEIARYPEAAKHFREARDLEPWRLDGLDLFGSCLWHLREEVELAFLAKDMEANDRLAPQTWCIVGNLYSLRQEHELAIKCFSRAIQLDPYYYYAYTLTGFEYKMKEEFEKSVDYFQKSIRIEPGPFNAWFGMGEIFFQQENYRTAQFHYDKAIKINPRNPIIQYHLGVILQKLEHPEKAISAFEKAVKLDEKNPLYRFRLAYALVQEKQYEKALHLLAPLEGFTQSESNVFLLIGRIHKALGNKSKALLAYTKARDHRGSRCDVINEAVGKLCFVS
ncbi:uncharacterized protein EV422DRAFT_491927 [Fimicolochytrium jonesii]|uniref:uncharacterized protein n=1 Tax=Fimicolochytrium jonesii TaxID=1396493 RepID=UPI0022FE1557|nr:uncharacterized protein EV422DRAFT_491927 [Fimicolochytrium jonesii]KAI8825730.1 hypothetical protein EV422DRAFT_491927 [Fimicolochytrium jonesii]